MPFIAGLIVYANFLKEKGYAVSTVEPSETAKRACADKGLNCYRYGFQFLRQGHGDLNSIAAMRLEMFQQLSDISYAFLDAGFIFITVIRDLKADEHQRLRRLSEPFDLVIMSLDDCFDKADFYAQKDGDILDYLKPY